MKKYALPLLLVLLVFCLSGCQRTLGEPGDMTIRNATRINVSKVDEIGSLTGDKLPAFRHNGDPLFESEVLNSEASGYNTVSYYETEFGYIDCTKNKYHKVGKVIPLSGFDTFSSTDGRYLYYAYAEFPEDVPYPKTQEEYNSLQEQTPTTVLQYDTETKEKKALQIDVPVALYTSMEGQKVYANSIWVSTGDLPQKNLAFLLDFEKGETNVLYSDETPETEFSWERVLVGERYLFSPDIYTESPTVSILDTRDLSVTVQPLDFTGMKLGGYQSIENIGDNLYLYALDGNNPFSGLCKYAPADNGFEKQSADQSELKKAYTYYGQAPSDSEDGKSVLLINDVVEDKQQILPIEIKDFSSPPAVHGSMLYPSSGENLILCSGTNQVWEWGPVFNLETDYEFYYVTEEEIARALGTLEE